MQRLRFCIFIFSFMRFSAQSAFAQEEIKIRVGSGGLLEGYYSIGLKLCCYISRVNNGILYEVVMPNKVSLENLWLLQRGKINFAFILSELAIDSFKGKEYFVTTEAFKNTPQVLNLRSKIFTVIVKDDNILVFSDLDGKKIANG